MDRYPSINSFVTDCVLCCCRCPYRRCFSCLWSLSCSCPFGCTRFYCFFSDEVGPLRKFHFSFHMWNTYRIGTFSHMKFSFHVWNRNIFTHEIPNSHVKLTGSKFLMWSLGVRSIYFTYEMRFSLTKINLKHEIFISHKELKQFTYERLFSFVKLNVELLKGLELNFMNIAEKWTFRYLVKGLGS